MAGPSPNITAELRRQAAAFRTTDDCAHSIEIKESLTPRTPLPNRYATFQTAVLMLCAVVLSSAAAAQVRRVELKPLEANLQPDKSDSRIVLMPSQSNQSPGSGYEGKTVRTIDISGVDQHSRDHLLQLLPQKAETPLDRDHVRDSIRLLYGTGRFADIQAEVAPSGDAVNLTFATSPNFFVGAVNVEGAPSRPNANQIVNSAKLQLGELYNRDKLNRALENIRQLLQENGYYRARVTAESTSNRGQSAGRRTLPRDNRIASARRRSEGDWYLESFCRPGSKSCTYESE